MDFGIILSNLIHFRSSGYLKPEWGFSVCHLVILENPDWPHCLGDDSFSPKFRFLSHPVSQTRWISVRCYCRICRIYSIQIVLLPIKRLSDITKEFLILCCCHLTKCWRIGTVIRLSIIDYWILHVTAYDEATIKSIFGDSIHLGFCFRLLTAHGSTCKDHGFRWVRNCFRCLHIILIFSMFPWVHVRSDRPVSKFVLIKIRWERCGSE